MPLPAVVTHAPTRASLSAPTAATAASVLVTSPALAPQRARYRAFTAAPPNPCGTSRFEAAAASCT